MSDLKLWQITAVADADDPRWQGQNAPRRILVAAATPARARLLAAAKLAGDESADIANEAGPTRSVVNDEKLYRVDPARSGDDASSKEEGVLEIKY